MKLTFRQRMFSWFDSYDIYDASGKTMYVVRGKPSWGHRLCIEDSAGHALGTLREVVLAMLPRFEIYIGNRLIGTIRKDLTLLRPRFSMDVNGWQIKGDCFEWDYRILDRQGRVVAVISKQLLHWTDTYIIDVSDPDDALAALMVVLAIDAEKCSRGR